MNNTIIPVKPKLSSDDYIAFDAMSLRNLIIKRLNDSGVYTDQNYLGSNLASIIDIISYSFNTLMFYLNKTSTESTFTETQLYENINNIVKLLDYKPIGYQTSTLPFRASINSTFEAGSYTIPRYSYVLAGTVSYSFNEDITFNVNQSFTSTDLTDLSNRKMVFQGTYRETPIVSAAGEKNETITINTANSLVDYFNIDVYVYEAVEQRWYKYQHVPNLYTEQTFSRSFEKRINSKYLYEITFGDGINGKRLQPGDRVIVYYLQSSGEQGIVGPGSLDSSNSTKVIFSTVNFDNIRKDIDNQQLNYITSNQFKNITFNNTVGSTLPNPVESVESIKKNAPANFKSQYRLVTKEDFETHIKINFEYFLSSVKVLNNWDYVGKYLKYFNDISIKPTQFKQILFNNILYADSCNFNNIYICGVPRVSKGSSLKYLLPAQKEIILSTIASLKPLTTEIVFVDPIYKAIDIGVNMSGTLDVLDRNACVLEVVRNGSSGRSNNSIKKDIQNIFDETFSLSDKAIGQTFDYSSFVGRLLSVDGVNQIRTRNTSTQEVYEGVSFYVWNPTYPDLDKQTVTNNLTLQDFEFMYFDNLRLLSQKIIIV